MCFLFPCPRCYKKTQSKAKKRSKAKKKLLKREEVNKNVESSPLLEAKSESSLDPSQLQEAAKPPTHTVHFAKDTPNWRSTMDSPCLNIRARSSHSRQKIDKCDCERCKRTRAWKSWNGSPDSWDNPAYSHWNTTPSPPNAEDWLADTYETGQNDTAWSPACYQPSQSPGCPHPTPISTLDQQHGSVVNPATMNYPHVYISPRSTPHISFPVVDYTTAHRSATSPPWPHFYMALVPECASVSDIDMQIAPPGSNMQLSARLSTTSESAKISEFADVKSLRCSTFQLEVWDAQDGTCKDSVGGTAGAEQEMNNYGFGGLGGAGFRKVKAKK